MLLTAPGFNQWALWDESKHMRTASREEKPQGLLRQEQTPIHRQPSAIQRDGGEVGNISSETGWKSAPGWCMEGGWTCML